MYILVHTLTGKKYDLNLEESSSIGSINNFIESQMGIPVQSQKLLANGKELSSNMVISDVATSSELNVYLVVSLSGGVKGKKKKKLVKKNKKPHKHLRKKLAILSYYKVEKDTVTRLRQQCKFCPPGTFLADHEDRLYCGRCHNSYKKTGTIVKKVKKVAVKAVVEESKDDKKGKKKAK